MKCEIIRDLFPSYIENLTSEESDHAIETHLSDCEACREYLNDMKKEIADTEKSDRDLEPFVKIRKNLLWKIFYTVLFTVTICGFLYENWHIYYYGGKSISSDEVTITLEEEYGVQMLVFEPKDDDIVISIGHTQNQEIDGKMPIETLNLIKRNKHPDINPMSDNQYKFVFTDENTMLELFSVPHKFTFTEEDFWAIPFDDCTKIIRLSDLQDGNIESLR